MTREEILNEWEKDAPLFATQIEVASINTPKLQSKYLRIRSQERMTLLALESEYKVLWVDRYDSFQEGESQESKAKGMKFPNRGKPLVKETERYVEIDEAVKKMGLRIGVQKEKISVLDEILKTLAARNWTINNIIKIRELESGK